MSERDLGRSLVLVETVGIIPPQVYLVTGSLDKVQLLMGLGIPAKLIAHEVDEREIEDRHLNGALGINGHMPVIPQAIAYSKIDLARQVNPHRFLLATDAAKIIDGRLLSKPHSLSEAVDMIMQQSGRKIVQVAATYLWDPLLHCWIVGSAKIPMQVKSIQVEEAEQYVRDNQSLICLAAGAMPIDAPGTMTLYERNKSTAPVKMEIYNENGIRSWSLELEISISDGNLIGLKRAVFGFHPPLLDAMGILRLKI